MTLAELIDAIERIKELRRMRELEAQKGDFEYDHIYFTSMNELELNTLESTSLLKDEYSE